ncbi:MAG: pectate lyase [Chthoniobacteraceae bacterium]
MMNPARIQVLAAILCVASSLAEDAPLSQQAIATMKRAATFYRTKVATHGGYVYYYSPDLSVRLGEGKATAEQIWVQPPGTPTVGAAFLKAFGATGDAFYLDAAREAAEALVFGQLQSGGWQQCIDFDPRGSKAAQLRNGKSRGRNHSTFDDGISQSALRFLMHADKALGFRHAGIHEASEVAREAVLAAQFPSGAFPQVWSGPVAPHPAVKANFPDYDWRTENRIKEYWDLPTLNDNLASAVLRTLEDAVAIYDDRRCRAAIAKLGDFLILAQMPEPQPGWAQQYDTKMRPVWARKFEPPAIAGRESEDAIETLLAVHRITGDAKYLEPIPRALAWLRRSLLPDGRLARYYELKTNQPLYMTRDYLLTHDDSAVPEHYGWKTSSKLGALENAYAAAKAGRPKPVASVAPAAAAVRQIVASLDAEGRWLSTYEGQGLTGQPKFKAGERFISSETFGANIEALAEFIGASGK